MNWIRTAVSVPVALLTVGCATLSARAHGELVTFRPEPARGDARRLLRDYERALQADVDPMAIEALPDAAGQVTTFERMLPARVTLKGVAGDFDATTDFEPVGKLTFGGPMLSAIPTLHSMWFWDYSGVGRKVACFPQVILTWLTLGLWGLIPLSYPCGTRLPTPDEAYGILRVAASAAGADAMVVIQTSQDRDRFWAAQAMLFRRKVQAAAAPQP